MAWNEPGGNDNDPWGNRKNSGGGGGNNNGGPPDLDEVFKNLKNKLDSLFGKKGSGNGSSFGSGSGGGGLSGGQIGGLGLSLIAIVALGFWGASGFYVVQPAEAGVETRFGKHTETTAPGWHWHIPWPVETVEKVDVAQVRTAKMNQQIALTQDENLVKITLSVQYNIQSAEQYLFNVKFPDQTLEQVVESAVREAIGQADMEAIITTEVLEVAEGDSEPVEVEDLQSITSSAVQAILDQYETGLIVTAVSLEEAQPPDEVQAAFSDAIKAREDKERIISEAEAYANEILPVARGDAARILEESEGYKTRVEQSALGESQRFLSLLKEYKKAPGVTRERLYIEAMESVLGNTSKVLVDQNEGGGNSLMYLPIDKLIGQGGGSTGAVTGNGRVGGMNSSANDAPRFTDLPLDQTDINRTNSRSRDRGVVR